MLVVDNFGITYLKQKDLDHLINSLKMYDDVALDTDGKEFVKINLDWDYSVDKLNILMQPYLENVL